MNTPTALLLSADELQELTGYRQRTRQLRWLRERLKIEPPQRADGQPVVSRAQVEAALSGQPKVASAGPKWSTPAP